MHFGPEGAKLWCHARQAGHEQQSTGLLRFILFESVSPPKAEKRHTKRCVFFLPKSNQTEQNRGKGKQKYTYYLSTSARSNLILNVNSSG